MLLSIGQLNATTGQTVTTIILGDSLSAAYNLPEEQGWVALLQTKLDQHQPDRYDLINASVSGETSGSGKSRLDDVLYQRDADYLLLELGANDGLRGLPLARIETNLRAIIEQAQDEGIEVILLGIMLPVNYGPHYNEPFAKLFTELGEEYQLPTLPFLLDGVATERDLMMDDGIHPNAEGQKQVLKNVWALLAPIWQLPELDDRHE